MTVKELMRILRHIEEDTPVSVETFDGGKKNDVCVVVEEDGIVIAEEADC